MKKLQIVILILATLDLLSQTCPCGNFGTASINKFYPGYSGGCITPSVSMTPARVFLNFDETFISFLSEPIVQSDSGKFCFDAEKNSGNPVDNMIERLRYGAVAGTYFAKIWNENNESFIDDISGISVVNSLQLTIEKENGTELKFGVQNSVNALEVPYCSEMFWVCYGGSDIYYSVAGNLTLRKGLKYYLSQSFIQKNANLIGNIDSTKCNYFIGKPIKLSTDCLGNSQIVEENIASLFLHIEKKFDRNKLIQLSKEFLKTSNQSNIISITNLSEDFFEFLRMLNNDPNAEIKISYSELCQLSNAILEYFEPCDTKPNLPEISDHYIKDTSTDKGKEPNTENSTVWESPWIWVRNNDDDIDTHENLIYNDNDSAYINVKVGSLDCGKISKSTKAKVYFSLSTTGLSWPDSWNNKLQVINGEEIFVGDQIGEIIVQEHDPNQTVKIKLPWKGINPSLFGEESLQVNVLVRIEDETDKIENENNNIVVNVRNNNNIAWRSFLITK